MKLSIVTTAFAAGAIATAAVFQPIGQAIAAGSTSCRPVINNDPSRFTQLLNSHLNDGSGYEVKASDTSVISGRTQYYALICKG